MRAVPFAEALEIPAELDKLVKFHLDDPNGGSKARNPSQVPKKRRPKGKKGRAAIVPSPTGNREGRHDKSGRDKIVVESSPRGARRRWPYSTAATRC